MKKNYKFMVCFILMICLSIYGVYNLSVIAGYNNDTDDATVPKHLDNFIPKDKNILLLVEDQISHCTDTIMIVNFKPNDGIFNVVSIPRDTNCLPNHETSVKLNSIYRDEGIDALKSLLNDMFDIKISNYVFLRIDIIKDLVDTLGPVEYKVPIRMKYRSRKQNLKIDLKKGKQLLDGDKVEQLLRYRMPNYGKPKPKGYYDYYAIPDFGRIETTQNFLQEFIKQKINMGTISKGSEIIDAIFKNLETDLTKNDCLKLISRSDKLINAKVNTFRMEAETPDIYTVRFSNTFKNTKTKKIISAQALSKKFVIKKNEKASQNTNEEN